MTGSQLTDGKVALSLNEMLVPGGQQGRRPSDEEPAGSAKRGFQPYHSKSVPKPENLEAQACKGAESGTPIRTMMLRNIPNKYVQSTLLEEIDHMGFVGTYDFFYLPMDVHNRSNVGYAFINFLVPADAERFRKVFSDHRFQRFQSRKVSSVCSAHVQGLDENLRHFENRAVTHARNDQYRPVVLSGNRRIDFEEAVAGARQRAAQAVLSPPAAAQPRGGGRAPGPRSGGAAEEAPEPAPWALGGGATGARRGADAGAKGAAAAAAAALLPAENWGRTPAPPPGLEAGPVVQAGNDIEQLLSLRSLLVERLAEKEGQAAAIAPEDVSRPTPRTNDLHPTSSLHELLAAEPWAAEPWARF